jgi:hypothetical protein
MHPAHGLDRHRRLAALVDAFLLGGVDADARKGVTVRTAMLPAACGRIAAGSRRIPTETTS